MNVKNFVIAGIIAVSAMMPFMADASFIIFEEEEGIIYTAYHYLYKREDSDNLFQYSSWTDIPRCYCSQAPILKLD